MPHIARNSDGLKCNTSWGSSSRVRLAHTPAMATSAVLLLFVFPATLAQDVRLRHKTSNNPVRLFTEEELQRYDGREVKFVDLFDECH